MANAHKHSPWRKSILIPFWCIQIFFTSLFIALLGLSESILYSDENSPDQDWDSTTFDNVDDPQQVVRVAASIVVPIYMALCATCLVFVIVEIILLARQKLRPLAFLVMNVIKATIWTGLFVLEIIAVAEGRAAPLGIIIDAILLLAFWIPLVYGSIIYRRFRKEKTSYKPVSHPYSNPVDVNTYESQVPQPKSYQPDIQRDIESNTAEGEGERRARSASFNHERDTRYDAYRRSSSSPQPPGMETFESRGFISDRKGIPQVYVENHDEDAIELSSRQELR